MTISKIAVIGLGYVGLPLVAELAKKFSVVGYDISTKKVNQLLDTSYQGDEICHVRKGVFTNNKKIKITSEISSVADADAIIVCVPTPVDSSNKPDFSALMTACENISPFIKKSCTIIFESTVYPGATEEICIPIIEKYSGLKWKTHFNIGYSPERINPGDKDHELSTIKKIISGDSEKTLCILEEIYGSIISAGLYRAKTIKIAEAAKVIENTQRDINIALINEFALIFDKLEIPTKEVLEAASTKWNFLPFVPGLVGGHCIGVDPYYLTHKAEMVGYHPQVILSGRRINDGMSSYIAQKMIKKMIVNHKQIRGSKIVIFGVTFKENCPDIRNSKVFDLINELKSYGCDIFAHDPIADFQDVESNYNIKLSTISDLPNKIDGCIYAVPHDIFKDDILNYLNNNDVPLIDIKGILYNKIKDKRNYWSL
jgi:UDP-N-acetyl-D-galactosamine dehydrogenase